MEKAAKRRMVIRDIIRSGGQALYYDKHYKTGFGPVLGKPPRWYSLLRHVYGDEHLGNAVNVYFDRTRITDDALVNLNLLTSLEVLSLDLTPITDAGSIHLKDIDTLEALSLHGTTITDGGLSHIKSMTALASLDIEGTRVTDGGLLHLKGLTQLQYLEISDTQAQP